MAKCFLTYEQQIDKLINEKGLLIADREYAENVLKRTSYYSLISGYKDLFKNPTTKAYRDGTRLEDIVALYDFDRMLRELFLSYILRVENHIKSLLSYAFCEKYGESQNAYLNKQNYNYSGRRNKADIDKLVDHVLAKYVTRNTDYHYINHARTVHGNVPLWILKNALTFGNISVMYSVFPQDIQFKISSEFQGINESQLKQVLRYLVRFRNVCAHGERLFSYRNVESIPDFPIHNKLQIPKNGNQYIYGKHDLFAVIITLRYLLPREDFRELKRRLTRLIDNHSKNQQGITQTELLKKMGFPENWKKITRYKL
ncbi:MAG: Abi family protein [Clostridiales bacterium]|nr:Abi family protein [Clostridiales bacterium]